jgi:hypothetical protein
MGKALRVRPGAVPLALLAAFTLGARQGAGAGARLLPSLYCLGMLTISDTT